MGKNAFNKANYCQVCRPDLQIVCDVWEASSVQMDENDPKIN